MHLFTEGVSLPLSSLRVGNREAAEHSLVQPCALQCVGSAECLSSTRVDSRWPRHTASSSGVRPLGSKRSRSCCKTKHTSSSSSSMSAMQFDMPKKPPSSIISSKKQNQTPVLPLSSVALDPAPGTDCSKPDNAKETLLEPCLTTVWELIRKATTSAATPQQTGAALIGTAA